MIAGVGVDIVDIERFKKWKNKDKLKKRFFHKQEIEESKKRGVAESMSLAARFAAKEAYGKALGCGLKGIKLKDIRVVSDESGKPDLIVCNTAETALKRFGASKIFISLSHEKDKAIAIVVLEK